MFSFSRITSLLYSLSFDKSWLTKNCHREDYSVGVFTVPVFCIQSQKKNRFILFLALFSA